MRQLRQKDFCLLSDTFNEGIGRSFAGFKLNTKLRDGLLQHFLLVFREQKLHNYGASWIKLYITVDKDLENTAVTAVSETKLLLKDNTGAPCRLMSHQISRPLLFNGKATDD